MSLTLPGYIQLPSASRRDLQHIPGDTGTPVVGNTLEFLKDPMAYCQRIHQRFGPISRGYFLFEPRVNLTSADGNAFVLLDRAGNFSAYGGWHPILGHLFPRGLMLRDGDDHRTHRRRMQPAFRKDALAHYLQRMQPRIADTINRWCGQNRIRFYPAVKQLTLQIAADVFLGLELDRDVDRVNVDFEQVVAASTAVNRLPLLGRRYARGRRARGRLARFLGQLIDSRRNSGGGDLFTQLCTAIDTSGRRYADDEIVDHLIFLMMAAHDTTTSALTTLAYALAANPDWQRQLREDVCALGDAPVDHSSAETLPRIGWAMREALRLYPPLITIVRRTVKACTFQGVEIPAHTAVNVFPIFTQRQPEWWTAPDRFDPERFSPQRAENRRHDFAWVPFGGGAHMCLGMHFAEMQVKAVMHALLQRAELRLEPGYRPDYKLAPIARPRDGLPLRLAPLSAA